MADDEEAASTEASPDRRGRREENRDQGADAEVPAPATDRSGLDTPLESTALPESLPCPFCESEDTEVFSSFGGQASTCQYYCNACRTVFEAMRWR